MPGRAAPAGYENCSVYDSVNVYGNANVTSMLLPVGASISGA